MLIALDDDDDRFSLQNERWLSRVRLWPALVYCFESRHTHAHTGSRSPNIDLRCCTHTTEGRPGEQEQSRRLAHRLRAPKQEGDSRDRNALPLLSLPHILTHTRSHTCIPEKGGRERMCVALWDHHQSLQQQQQRWLRLQASLALIHKLNRDSRLR